MRLSRKVKSIESIVLVLASTRREKLKILAAFFFSAPPPQQDEVERKASLFTFKIPNISATSEAKAVEGRRNYVEFYSQTFPAFCAKLFCIVLAFAQTKPFLDESL